MLGGETIQHPASSSLLPQPTCSWKWVEKCKSKWRGASLALLLVPLVPLEISRSLACASQLCNSITPYPSFYFLLLHPFTAQSNSSFLLLLLHPIAPSSYLVIRRASDKPDRGWPSNEIERPTQFKLYANWMARLTFGWYPQPAASFILCYL